MSKQELKIDRLQIRLQGVSPRLARTAVNDLGHALLAQLASSGQLSGRRGRIGIPAIDIGTVRVSGQPEPAELQRAIVQNVAASIDAQVKRME